ncbi:MULTISPECIES: FxSxx-COOH system tetratricopeptide repeat protein [unclassified Streptomyces]|uniref:FxSxx-COOH system tetratricopeptide repeat protein n=1 Tax=unclassified Streptomyces TaxID=2593676 RepID=UPI003811FDF7
MAEPPQHAEVFVSHAGADLAWAEWTAWQVEESGRTVELGLWDWPAGANAVLRHSEAVGRAACLLVLLSAFCGAPGDEATATWTAALARADGGEGRLVPVLLEPLAPDAVPALLRPLRPVALHGLDEQQAVRALRAALAGSRRPSDAPHFSGRSRPRGGAGRRPGAGVAPRLPVTTPAVWQAPGRNPQFSGREREIAGVRTALRDGTGTVVVQALHGLGGVGKTQLATEYVHRFASQYDTVWWIDAEQADRIPSQLAEMGTALTGTPAAADTRRAAREALRELCAGTDWLVVLDNAEGPEEVFPWIPSAGSGHVLITSRNPDWSDTAVTAPLGVLNRTESVALLRARVPSLDPAEADALAGDLGDLPLALAQAAGVLAAGMPARTYRGLLVSDSHQVLDEGRPRSYPRTLAGAVTIAHDRLALERPSAAALLLLCVFLAPEPIPTAWFVGARDALTTVAVPPDRTAMWPWNDLALLARYGLARTDDRGVSVHRLTQTVLRARTGAAETARVAADLVTLLGRNDPGGTETPATWPDWARLLPHLRRVVERAADDPPLRDMACRAARSLLVTGQAAAGAEFTEALYDAWRTALGDDHPDVLALAQQRGHALHMLGRYEEARVINLGILEQRAARLGRDHPDTLHAAHALAACLRPLGRHEEAVALDEHTFVVRRRIFGADDPLTLVSAHDLAAGLRAWGDHARARVLCEETRERALRVLGEDHPFTLVAAHDLAASLRGLGEFEAARPLDEEALEGRRRTLGEDHPHTLYSANGLAADLRGLGDHQAAHTLDQDTLERRRRTLGEEHPQVRVSLRALAADQLGLGAVATDRTDKPDGPGGPGDGDAPALRAVPDAEAAPPVEESAGTATVPDPAVRS